MCDLIDCNFWDIRHKIRLWVSIYDLFLAVLALSSAWINESTPESSIVHYYSFSTQVFFLAVPSDIEEDNMEHTQNLLCPGQARRHKLLRTTIAPPWMEQSCTDIVISPALLPNPRNPPATMAPPLLKHQQSTVLKILLESDHAPSPQALVLPNMSSGDQNVSKPKASSD